MPRKSKPKITEALINQKVKEIESKNDVIQAQEFYVNGTLNNLEEIVKQKQEEIVKKVDEYNKMMTQEILNEDGEIEEIKEKPYNPYLVSTFFFKSINPLTNIEPQYSSEKLAVVWNLYMELIEKVNVYVGVIQPTLSHFAKFAGISTATLKQYKNSPDLQMKILINKIFDETFDSNVLLAQNKKLSNRSTELRVKVENEVQEKPQVKVNVNVNQDADLGQISARLEELSKFKAQNSKMKRIEVDSYDEE